MNEEELPRSVVWLGVSTLAGSLMVRLIDYWRWRIERSFTESDEEGKVLTYPWLAHHPVWIGVFFGLIVFAIGLYLIRGYTRTTYLRPEPTPTAS